MTQPTRRHSSPGMLAADPAHPAGSHATPPPTAPPPTAPPAAAAARPTPLRRPARLVAFLRRHLGFGLLFLAGAALRGLAVYAYRPAFEFDGDSYAVADAGEAASLADELIEPGDVMLVKGSRGVGLEVVAEALLEAAPHG